MPGGGGVGWEMRFHARRASHSLRWSPGAGTPPGISPPPSSRPTARPRGPRARPSRVSTRTDGEGGRSLCDFLFETRLVLSSPDIKAWRRQELTKTSRNRGEPDASPGRGFSGLEVKLSLETPEGQSTEPALSGHYCPCCSRKEQATFTETGLLLVTTLFVC